MINSNKCINFTATLIIILTILVTNSNAANILVIIAVPSYSHQQPMLTLSYALGAKGHNVTVMTTDPSKEPIKNVRQLNFSSLYDDWKEMQRLGTMPLQTMRDPLELIWDLYVSAEFICTAIAKKPVFKEFIREVNGTKFDLIIYEAFGYSSLLGISELIGRPPTIGMATSHPYIMSDESAGNPFTPSYIPSIHLGLGDRMCLWDRLMNFYTQWYSCYVLYWRMYPGQQKLMTQIFGDLPYTAKELEFNKSLLFVSADEITGYSKPKHPNTIYLGPLHTDDKLQPLPHDLQKWMDEAEEGVVYFSMGSNMKGTSVPEHIRAAFINAFKQFPQVRVLWKWETDTKLPGQPGNVLVRKWFPQKSIIAHQKLKLFIGQCGLQSLQEAISRGVPLLCMPVFADQFFNTKRLISHGVALGLDFKKITSEEIHEKLKVLLTDPSYKENMRRLSSIAKDKPMSSMDTAIWWVEYVLRHKGAPHLRPASLDLTWYQYYMLDILLIVLIFVLIICGITYFALYKLVCLFYLNNSTEKVKVKKT